MAGDAMADLVPGRRDVALIGGISGDVTSGARVDGLHAGRVGASFKTPRPSPPTGTARWR